MSPKVFGIGWAKTGTTTLGRCLSILGYLHHGPRLDLVLDVANSDLRRIKHLAEEHESFTDWPWTLLYRELDKTFPGSRFVLTTRAPERWIRSYLNMIAGQGEPTESLNSIRRVIYGIPFPNSSSSDLLARYHRHTNNVLEYFKDRPNSLLVCDWENGDGWEKLCNFLGKPVPAAAFPHENAGIYASPQ